jgi:hypothetical protein
MNKQVTARHINHLARLRRQAAAIHDRAEQLTLQLIKHGGGESDRYVATVVNQPAKDIHIPKHKQLRLTEV